MSDSQKFQLFARVTRLFRERGFGFAELLLEDGTPVPVYFHVANMVEYRIRGAEIVEMQGRNASMPQEGDELELLMIDATMDEHGRIPAVKWQLPNAFEKIEEASENAKRTLALLAEKAAARELERQKAIRDSQDRSRGGSSSKKKVRA